jgi:long-chain acyl-CoA synthetase
MKMSTDVTTASEPAAASGSPGNGFIATARAPEGVEISAKARSIPELFQAQVARRAGKPAMFFRAGGKWNPISWELYGQAVQRLTGYLLGEGVAAGQRVGILSYNRPEWHIADLATQHAGGTTVGIYLTNSPAQCQYILEHAEAPICVVENRDQLKKILAVKDQLTKLRRIVLISGDTEASDGDLVITWADALNQGVEYNRSHPDAFEERWKAVKPTDMATFIYTSGTTGPPKAVMLDQGNLCWTVESIKGTIELGDADEDVTVSYLPLAHIAERMAGHILHIENGHRLYFAEDLLHLKDALAEARPTFMFGVPRIWEKFQQGVQGQLKAASGIKGLIGNWAMGVGYKVGDLKASGKAPGGMLAMQHKYADKLALSKFRAALGLDHIKQTSTGAAPIGLETLRFFWALGIPMYEVYGQSEDCGPTSTNRTGLCKLGTVGPAMPGLEVSIAQDGEVLVKGGNVFRGYFKDEQATAEALDDQGYLHSGDVGELDADGFLRITDRKKDLIITAGGKNISPSNIEVALKREIGFAGQAVAIGDRRPFMSALLTIDAEQVKGLAAEVGEPADMKALSESEKVHTLFQKGVDAVNRNLSNVEAIKKFVILPSDLSVDGGELTPTMKVKRKVVNEKYGDFIESIYSKPE